MRSRLLLCLVVVATSPFNAAAQKGSAAGVDWDAKAIATELGRLGDPEINMFLPEIYRALAESREQAPDAAPTSPKKIVAPTPHVLNLLSSPVVRREIEMLDEQYQDVLSRSRSIQADLTRHVGSLVVSAQGNVDREELRRKIMEMREAAKKEVEQAILPFQLRRLEQIALQVQIQRQSMVSVLTRDPIASELKVTDEQKERLRERAVEIDEQLARDIARLRAQARSELLRELKSDQRRKFVKLMGDEFDVQDVKMSGKPGGKQVQKSSKPANSPGETKRAAQQQ
jgi:hypothetical protein